jgi:nucleotide-binding universal stress UspA family protein
MQSRFAPHDVRRILVTLDGSPVAEEVLPHAIVQARAFGAELVLLQVVPTLLPGARPSEPLHADDETTPASAKAAENYLKAAAENLATYDVRATYHVRRGPVVATILDEIAHGTIDMVAMTTHGSGRLPRLLFGSVASQILSQAPCPVLLIRGRDVRTGVAHVRNFSEDAAAYGLLTQRPLGLRTVALNRIVGSVGRAKELDAAFMSARMRKGDKRFRRILKALEQGEILPPVELYRLGYDYYVLDGNHRVAAARALGQHDIDAVVTEFLPTDDVDAQRVFLERRNFEVQTGLTRIGATRPGHYPRLLELIQDYARSEKIEDLQMAARLWYERVYRHMAGRLRSAQLARLFPGERTADLLVHLADLREAESARQGREISWEEALSQMLQRYRRIDRHVRLRLPALRQLLVRRRRTPADEP